MQKEQQNFWQEWVQNSSEQFQVLEQASVMKQDPESNLQVPPTISIKLNGIYIVIPKSQAQTHFTCQQEWNQLLSKKFEQRKTSISITGLNSIICMDGKQSKQVWEKISSQLSQQDKYISEIETQVSAKTIKQVKKNIEKMFKRIRVSEKDQQYLKILLSHVISLYQLRQPHLGVLKGIEYICYAIYQCFDKKTAPLLYNSLAYLMVTQGLCQVFYNSSQIFYSEVDSICEQLKAECPKIYDILNEANADWPRIFISYYRSLLLYGITNKVVTNVILDLIGIYGINVIRIILVRLIVNRQQELIKITDPEKLMGILATSLISHQFQPPAETKKGKWQTNKIQNQSSNSNRGYEKQSQQNEKSIRLRFRKLIIGI